MKRELEMTKRLLEIEKENAKRIDYLLITCLFLIMFKTSYGQLVLNDSTKFEIRRTSLKFITPNKIEKSKYLITVEEKSKDLKFLKTLNKQSIILLLEDENFDWRINLILYDVFKKDALLFYVFDIRNRLDWVKYDKDKDIIYWKKELDNYGIFPLARE
ncbi:hypothetical protein [Aureivirga sp. CE67]|uniref:hypothetical protein n=1 Tax=Aureivirga sp. CE67 TaxID=1788983 RepID=UPI0018C9CD37|nr:hypothetical protein [Aureivirga sp. CE67]